MAGNCSYSARTLSPFVFLDGELPGKPLSCFRRLLPCVFPDGGVTWETILLLPELLPIVFPDAHGPSGKEMHAAGALNVYLLSCTTLPVVP